MLVAVTCCLICVSDDNILHVSLTIITQVAAMEENSHDSGKDFFDLNNTQLGVVDSREDVTIPTGELIC